LLVLMRLECRVGAAPLRFFAISCVIDKFERLLFRCKSQGEEEARSPWNCGEGRKWLVSCVELVK
jgi:hypothetical protein